MTLSLLNNLFGFRWSLYIVRDGKNIAYAMHDNSVIGLAGYAMSYFAQGALPVDPWTLCLNFNKSHKTIILQSKHFTPDGENVTPALIAEVEMIDPGWRVKGGEPVFEEAATKKRLSISQSSLGRIDIEKMMRDIEKPREVTFFSVMEQVFGKA